MSFNEISIALAEPVIIFYDICLSSRLSLVRQRVSSLADDATARAPGVRLVIEKFVSNFFSGANYRIYLPLKRSARYPRTRMINISLIYPEAACFVEAREGEMV